MPKLQRRSFGDADDVRQIPFGRLEIYDLGDVRLGRSVLEPGWRWSESVKPIAQTDLCEDAHIGVCLAGSARISMREGAEMTIEPGQFYEIPPGHDSWVVGDEDWVTITWRPSTAFARSQGGAFDRIVTTLLMTDIVDSTVRAREMGDGPWRDLLARHNQIVRGLLEHYRGREVKMTGDGFLAVFDGAERAIRAAQDIRAAVAEIGVQLRAGIHTGEIELEGSDVRGLGVHICARIVALGGPNEILASSATRELLTGSPIEFEDRGLYELKGIDEPRRVYAVR